VLVFPWYTTVVVSSQRQIRNFSIIAHIDHGKSTLADRLLELTGTVLRSAMKDRLLDRMELEQEKGITIKLKPVRMNYPFQGEDYIFNLIDTPGHVDFAYEVSRSLAACEGALLLVDAASGIQAQTLANFEKAQAQNLVIIPVINKIDLREARAEEIAQDLVDNLGFTREEIIFVSAKLGTNTEQILEAVAARIPFPVGNRDAPFRALVFDSFYDEHRGVVAVVRVVDGELAPGAKINLLGTGAVAEAAEVGYFTPEMTAAGALGVGEVGYVVTGLKDLAQVRVGDTLVAGGSGAKALPGYQEPKPMIFASFYPEDAGDYLKLRRALETLHLSDASFTFAPESSPALGRGFRLGFLGILHGEITKERISREHGVQVLVTPPMVSYQVDTAEGTTVARSAADFPNFSQIKEVREPWLRVVVYTPTDYLGNIFELCQRARGRARRQECFGERVKLVYELPLAAMLAGFYDQLKSLSSGFASLEYEVLDYRSVDVVRLDILLHHEVAEALSQIVLKGQAYRVGRSLVARLKDVLPRQQFAVAVQAAVGGKVIARETVPALRKDVTAKLYGGDQTRKDKLLKRQKKGKKELAKHGRVGLSSEALSALWQAR